MGFKFIVQSVMKNRGWDYDAHTDTGAGEMIERLHKRETLSHTEDERLNGIFYFYIKFMKACWLLRELSAPRTNALMLRGLVWSHHLVSAPLRLVLILVVRS